MKILTDDDPHLSLPCAEVEADTWPAKRVILEMQLLRVDSNGAGLAAPQVGIMLRFCVIDPQYCPGLMLGVLINPCIVARSDDAHYADEGCLSFPGQTTSMYRSHAVKVRFSDFGGRDCSRWFYGFAARLLQHEIDHLDGITITQFQHKDRLPCV